jgi:probable rRNA maturation factor
MAINIQINTKEKPRDLARGKETKKYKEIISTAGETASVFLGIEEKSFSVLLTDDSKMRKLNKKFRNVDNSTDVLSFPYMEKDSSYLGDIAISLNKTKEHTKLYKEDFENELARLLIHGILHLLGEKDYTQKDKRKMWEKQEKILELLKTKKEVNG